MKAEESLVAAWKTSPEEEQRLLVRVDADMEGSEDALSQQGVTVRRRCKLINCYVITCTGTQALGLLDLDWVQSVERDEPVAGYGSSGGPEE